MIDKIEFNEYSQIIFDLDDTLIYEKDYLYEAYKSISNELGKNETEKKSMFNYLKNNFDLGNRKLLFNEFIITYKKPPEVLHYMLEELRKIDIIGGLNITKEAKYILDILKKLKKEYIIITNGNPIQQANKLSQIKWEEHLQPSKVFFANQYSPKPNPDVFYIVKDLYSPKKVLYIGDSEVDREFAINSGIDFFLIETKK